MRGSVIQDIGYWRGLLKLLNAKLLRVINVLSGLNVIVPPLASLQRLQRQKQEIAKSQGAGRGLY